jgi:hypothetical protein
VPRTSGGMLSMRPHFKNGTRLLLERKGSYWRMMRGDVDDLWSMLQSIKDRTGNCTIGEIYGACCRVSRTGLGTVL